MDLLDADGITVRWALCRAWHHMDLRCRQPLGLFRVVSAAAPDGGWAWQADVEECSETESDDEVPLAP